MKRGILAFAACAAVLAAPVAMSGGAVKARGGDDFRVRFVLQTFNGEPTALKRFRFSRLNGTCDNGVTVSIRGKIGTIEINDRNRFGETLRRNGRTVRVKGKVSGDLDTVRGIIRAKGDFPPDGENCGTGRVRWKAS